MFYKLLDCLMFVFFAEWIVIGVVMMYELGANFEHRQLGRKAAKLIVEELKRREQV